jgi:hypothetical protein
MIAGGEGRQLDGIVWCMVRMVLMELIAFRCLDLYFAPASSAHRIASHRIASHRIASHHQSRHAFDASSVPRRSFHWNWSTIQYNRIPLSLVHDDLQFIASLEIQGFGSTN